jgi:hypothetical protein
MSVATRDWSASWMMSSPTPSLKQGDRDRAACAAGPDEQYPRSLRLSSMVLLRLHEGESVEHVAVPGPVRIAADDAHDPEHLGALRTGGAVGEGGELVRHGDEDAVDVPRSREPSDDGVEVIGRYLHRNADAVVAALIERASKTHRRLNVLNGVADDREQPRGAAELTEHVNSSLRVAASSPGQILSAHHSVGADCVGWQFDGRPIDCRLCLQKGGSVPLDGTLPERASSLGTESGLPNWAPSK